MWGVQTEELAERRGLRHRVVWDSRPASFADVTHAWQNDANFRLWFNTLLADAPYTAFRWETPGVTADTVSQSFECVILESPGLARRPDPDAFTEHFTSATGVAVFPNLGRDAIMVMPCPVGDAQAYGHLAAFVRFAPEPQRHALWQAVGEAMTARIGARPVWLSTAGAGVSWLHVRLDDRPKYYGFAPYQRRPVPAA